jgi:hypothetical protein
MLAEVAVTFFPALSLHFWEAEENRENKQESLFPGQGLEPPWVATFVESSNKFS